MDNADPEDTLPDLPASSPIEASDNTRDTIKGPERLESSLRTVVTLTETMTSIASKTTNIPDVHEPACNQTATSRSEVTESTKTTTSAVIEIVPSIDPTLDTDN